MHRPNLLSLARLLLVLASIGVTSAAEAVGSLCRPNVTLNAIEKAICADAKLPSLDTELDGLYAMLNALPGERKQLRDEQRRWLAERDRCADRDCIEAAYARRIKELRRMIDARAQPLPMRLVGRRTERDESSEACRQYGTASYFEVRLERVGNRAKGRIEGLYKCGEKLWDPVDLEGTITGKLATVSFEGGFNREAPMRAFIAFTGREILWYVFDLPENDEFYMPAFDRLPLAR